MDIVSIIGDVLGNIGGVVGIVTNPAESIKTIAIGAGAVFLGIPILDAVFKSLDDAIIYIDDMVIDKIPFKPAKDFFQNKLIDRLKKRIKRYDQLIEKISD